MARSDLSIPEAAAKAMSIYLLFAIGFKGGVSVSSHGIDLTLGMALLAGIVLGGSGRSGEWSREGQVGRTTGMVQVVCVIRPDRLDGLLEAIFSVVDRHIGVVTVSDVEILRAERF